MCENALVARFLYTTEEKWAKRQPSKVKPYAHRNLCDVASNYIKKSESESSAKSHGRKQAGLIKNCSSRKLSNCKETSKRSTEKKDCKILPQPVNEVSETKQRNFEVDDAPDAVTTGVLTAKIEIIKKFIEIQNSLALRII